MENSTEIPQKLKIELLYDPATPLLGTYLKKIKYYFEKYVFPSFTAALFTRAKIRKQPKCPLIDEWIKKMNKEDYYSAKKKKPHKTEILPFVTTWMDLESFILNELSQRKTNTI